MSKSLLRQRKKDVTKMKEQQLSRLEDNRELGTDSQKKPRCSQILQHKLGRWGEAVTDQHGRALSRSFLAAGEWPARAPEDALGSGVKTWL